MRLITCAQVRRMRIGELLRTAIRLSGVKAEIRPAAHLMRPSDEKIIFGSTDKFRKDTGWTPKLRSNRHYRPCWSTGTECSNGKSFFILSAEGGEAIMTAISDIPVVLLVGGQGTRLRSIVPSTPKPLAWVGDKSFLRAVGSATPIPGNSPFGDVYGLSWRPDRKNVW